MFIGGDAFTCHGGGGVKKSLFLRISLPKRESTSLVETRGSGVSVTEDAVKGIIAESFRSRVWSRSNGSALNVPSKIMPHCTELAVLHSIPLVQCSCTGMGIGTEDDCTGM